MITSIFNKTTPLNYSLLAILVLICFFISLSVNDLLVFDYLYVLRNIGLFVVLFSSLFLANFIAKKNALTKDSAFALLFYFLLHLFFPKILVDLNLLLANLFILLALRRLIYLQTLKNPKQKILDASLWILAASIINYWCVFYFVLVYASIIFHVSRDYRNWLIPIVAALTFISIFVFASLFFKQNWIDDYLDHMQYSFDMDYFKANIENVAFSVFSVFVFVFLTNSVFKLTSKPLNLQDSYKKIVLSFLIAVAVFIFSSHKSNETLVFTFFPLCIMATNFVEYSQNTINRNLAVILSLLASIILFVLQL